ncbi:hypothetical protein ABZP36_014854 [Zizania latifolia]
MATTVLFTETVTFDVSSGDNYGDFIARIRNKLSKRHFSHNRPVLPPGEPNVPPCLWFYVELRTTSPPPCSVRSTDARPPTKFTPFNDMGVKTVEEAAATVRILLFVEVPGGMTAKKALELYSGN